MNELACFPDKSTQSKTKGWVAGNKNERQSPRWRRVRSRKAEIINTRQQQEEVEGESERRERGKATGIGRLHEARKRSKSCGGRERTQNAVHQWISGADRRAKREEWRENKSTAGRDRETHTQNGKRENDDSSQEDKRTGDQGNKGKKAKGETKASRKNQKKVGSDSERKCHEGEGSETEHEIENNLSLDMVIMEQEERVVGIKQQQDTSRTDEN